jgi:uncharacterized protein
VDLVCALHSSIHPNPRGHLRASGCRSLKEPVRPRVRRIIAVGDLAVAEWHGRATSIADGPYDNDYCWVIRVAEDRIVEVRAYFDGALVEELFRTTER